MKGLQPSLTKILLDFKPALAGFFLSQFYRDLAVLLYFRFASFQDLGFLFSPVFGFLVLGFCLMKSSNLDFKLCFLGCQLFIFASFQVTSFSVHGLVHYGSCFGSYANPRGCWKVHGFMLFLHRTKILLLVKSQEQFAQCKFQTQISPYPKKTMNP